MAYDAGGIDLSFLAGEDLSGHQYKFVVLADADTVRMPDGATEALLGILQNNPEAGEPATVRVSGVSKIVAGAGGLAVNAAVKLEHVSTSDTGKGLATTTAGDMVRGRVLFPAGSEDDVATVLMTDYPVPA